MLLTVSNVAESRHPVYILVWNCSSRFSTSSWSIMRSAWRDARLYLIHECYVYLGAQM